jgi:ribonuclease BN (tRNA processing enzyme)
MRLTILGRSPARPNPGEPCAGYLVEGGNSRILLDAGPGVVAQLLRRAKPEELDAVVISHMHTDHFLDLVTLRYSYPWVDLAPKRLRVVVPPGSAEQLQDVARGAGFPDFFAKSFQFEEHDGRTPFEVGDLSLEPYETQHFVRTWGFRIEARGTDEPRSRVLAYSADTAPTPSLQQLAQGAALFLCEAALRSLADDPPAPDERGHLLPSEAGAAAQGAGVERLILTHLPIDNGGDWAREQAAAEFPGPVEVAELLKTYDV